MASRIMEVAALGRPFTVGMLYDARKDELIPGVKLWDDKILQEKTEENDQPSSEFQITASDSIEEKFSAFNDLAEGLKDNSRTRFLVAAILNKRYQGASIYHYSNSNLVTDNYSKPDVTNVESVKRRSDLIPYARQLTLDQDTANCTLKLSEENRRATHGKRQSYPDLPQRFDRVPQVLSREALTGRCYWEVEMSMDRGSDAAVAICYKGLKRKGKVCGLGWDQNSWSLGFKWSPEPHFYAEHNRNIFTYGRPSTDPVGRLGVFLDWTAGTLSYYIVSGDALSHRGSFNQPVYVAFKLIKNNNYVFLCL
ncbi:neoverrucotoxin subunit alpha-like [Brachyistius frenatus]|uniref:neoverrucotoxin subunit alpha-like n=1 Tax=Brachyistius frenatus TaxID=100188 RepID=UPI0037E8C661